MNAYLKRLHEQHAAHRKTIEDLINRAAAENRDITAEELTTTRGLGEQAKTLGEQITELTEIETRNAEVAELDARIDRGREEAGDPDADPDYDAAAAGPPPLLPAAADTGLLLRAASRGETIRLLTRPSPLWAGIETRAVVTTAQSGASTGAVDRVLPEPRRLSVQAGLVSVPLEGAQAASFNTFAAQAAQAATAENVAKPEGPAVAAGSVTPGALSRWSDVSRQAMLTRSGFEQRIRSKIAQLVAMDEDSLLVTLALAATVQTHAKLAGQSREAALMQGATTILGAASAEPNLVVLNPTDAGLLFGTATGPAGEAPEAALRLDVRGMRGYVTNAIAAGTVLLGAWPTGSALGVGLPMTYLVDAVSGLKNNRVTVLGEELVTLLVDDPNCFYKITTFGT